ncbi:HYR-like domain-containing protein, partial [Flavobacterium psychrotolerans]
CAGSYSVTRTWTAKDGCNNSSTASQTINVQDITAPTITTVASDQTVLCDGAGNSLEFQAWLNTNAGSSATDNCSSLTWSNEILSVIPQCGGTSKTLVRFSATDACNNSKKTTALFTILDLIPPTLITVASDLTVECDGNGNTLDLNSWLSNNGGATATDLCGKVTWSNNFTTLSDDCGKTGSANVIFKATDDCGNFITTTAKFGIKDTIAPIAPTAPSNLTVSCAGDVPVTIALTTTDICSGTISALGKDTIVQGNCPNSFVLTRTWTFADACNNSSTTVQIITVEDKTTPIIAPLPATSTISCPATPVFTIATATDGCGSAFTLTSTDVTTPGVCTGSYSVTRTWTATDGCNNSSTASQTINVQDITAPTITAQASNITVECDGSGNQTAIAG